MSITIATHCNTLQHTATHCKTLQHTATHCNTLHHTATQLRFDAMEQETFTYVPITISTHCNTLQHTATHCNTLQHTATHMIRCNGKTPSRTCQSQLQNTATHCNTLQHTATHCNTLQHIRFDATEQETFTITPITIVTIARSKSAGP